TVDFEDCNKCEVDFNIDRECNQVSVSYYSRFVDVNCAIFQIDDVNIDPNTFYTLSPGEHEICMFYLGTQKGDPNQKCCDKICETIIIEGVQYVTENFDYCYMAPKFGLGYK